MLCAVETADSPSDGLWGMTCGTQSAGGKTLTDMAGRNRGIMPVHHIHHDWLTSVTAGYWEMTSSIKSESIPELSCSTHYSALYPVQQYITTMLLFYWHAPYLHSHLAGAGAMHGTYHATCCMFCHVLRYTFSISWIVSESSHKLACLSCSEVPDCKKGNAVSIPGSNAYISSITVKYRSHMLYVLYIHVYIHIQRVPKQQNRQIACNSWVTCTTVSNITTFAGFQQ